MLNLAIRGEDKKRILFTADVLSQPNGRTKWFQSDPYLHTKCSRALPLARKGDVVVLSGSLNKEYYRWLQENDFTTDTVVAYNKSPAATPLSEYILEAPDRIKQALSAPPEDYIYAPFYCATNDLAAAKLLGMSVLGNDEKITLSYFDKTEFKELCLRLGIPIVPQSSGTISEYPSKEELAQVLEVLLNNYGSLIVRGNVGSAGDSVYVVKNETLSNILERIEKGHADKFLIEPYLDVISSPNDQWIISPDGKLNYIGLSAQLFEGLSHRGNLHGQFFSSRVVSTIHNYSVQIGNHMKEQGYRGVFGVDYIVTDEGIFPIENNARMNGSTFAFGIVERIQEQVGSTPCWRFFKAKAGNKLTFNELKMQLKRFIYDGVRQNGVFPTDVDTIEINGYFNCLIYGEDMYHLESISSAIENLGIERA